MDRAGGRNDLVRRTRRQVHGDGGGGGGEVGGVGPGAAIDGIVAGTAHDHVVRRVAGEGVVEGRAAHLLDIDEGVRAAGAIGRRARRQVDGDRAGGGGVVGRVDAVAAVEGIVAASARENIVAGAAVEGVVAASARKNVVAAAAEELIVAGAAREHIVVAETAVTVQIA